MIFGNSGLGKSPTYVSNSKSIGVARGNCVRAAFVLFLQLFCASDFQQIFVFWNFISGGLVSFGPNYTWGTHRARLAERPGFTSNTSKAHARPPASAKNLDSCSGGLSLTSREPTVKHSGDGTRMKQHDTSPCGRSHGKR